MHVVALALLLAAPLPPRAVDKPELPAGFVPLFNGRDLSGWHVSKTNHHGTTPEWRALHGALVGTQSPYDRGGILLTDRNYKNFELVAEVKPDFGCDGGIFLRSNEAGEAYQVMLDYLDKGNIGGVYGEGLKGVKTQTSKGWEQAWKREAWNKIRIRVEGKVPHVQVWINDVQVTDYTDTANHAAGGADGGMIAVQVHFSDANTPRWERAGFHRFRNVGIKVLPDSP